MVRTGLVILLVLAPATGLADEPVEPLRPPFMPDMRLAVGAGAKVRSGVVGYWGAALDVQFQPRIALPGLMGLFPEVGYSAWADDEVSDHYGTLGVGFGAHAGWWAAGIVPTFLVGGVQPTPDDDLLFALGYRTTLFFEFPRFGGFQAAHQVLFFNGDHIHEFRFMLSIHSILIDWCWPLLHILLH